MKGCLLVFICCGSIGWAATNGLSSLLPPTPPTSTNKTIAAVNPPVSIPQYAEVSWITNAEAASYMVQSTTDFKTWKWEGSYPGTNSVSLFIGNTKNKAFRVYGHAEETNHFVGLAFNYTNAPYVDKFRVYYGTNQGIYPLFVTWARTNFNTNEYHVSISNLLSQKTYYFRAVAIDSGMGYESDLTPEEVEHETPTNAWKYHKQVPARLRLVYSATGVVQRVVTPAKIQPTNSLPSTKTNTIDKTLKLR